MAGMEEDGFRTSFGRMEEWPPPPDVVVPPLRIAPIRWRGKVLEGRWGGRLPVVAELEIRFIPGVRCKLRPKRACTLSVRMEENWLGTSGSARLRESLRLMRTGECADCGSPLRPNPSALAKAVLCVCCRKPKAQVHRLHGRGARLLARLRGGVPVRRRR